MASRSRRKRAMSSAAGVSSFALLRDTSLGHARFHFRRQPLAVKLVELGIDLAHFAGRLLELGQRLGEIIKAVRRALAVRVLLVVLIERYCGEARCARIEIGAAEQVLREAGAAVLRIFGRDSLELAARLGVKLGLPQPIAIGVAILGRIAGAGLFDRRDLLRARAVRLGGRAVLRRRAR